MMKKLLSLMLMLCLLFSVTSAQAEELSPVYTLVNVGEDGATTVLGTAVLLGDQSTLVTTCWAVGTEELVMAVGNGDTLTVAAAEALFEGSCLMTLTLAEPSPAQPISLGEISKPMTCVAATAQGLTQQPATHVTLTAYEHETALLYTGVEGALPGGVLLNDQGQLAGLTVANYGEGLNRYVAYAADTLKARLAGEPSTDAAAKQESGVQWLTDFSVIVEKGVMTVDWSSCTEPENAADSAFLLIWEAEQNQYCSYAEISWGEETAFVGVAPGHSYRVWLRQSPAGETGLDANIPVQKAVTCAVPSAEPFTDMAFRDESIWLGVAPASQVPGLMEVVPALETVTVEALSDPDSCYYLQVTSTYQTTETLEANLLIVLTAPDGSVYTDLSGFIFMPELCAGDSWHADITDLVSSCMEFTGAMTGMYTLSYYLDGQLANEIVFTLE